MKLGIYNSVRSPLARPAMWVSFFNKLRLSKLLKMQNTRTRLEARLQQFKISCENRDLQIQQQSESLAVVLNYFNLLFFV